MPRPPTVAELLSTLEADQAAFATRLTLDFDPRIEVDGVGAIALPISAGTAHRLCAQATLARHGYKDETRLDLDVRDTWEIPASAVRLTAEGWPAVLDHTLARIQEELGLPTASRLTAAPDKLLIYGPGQFFLPHQDTEKEDGMMATLIITLPSDFSGGEFRVSHQNQTLRSRGSRKHLSVVAFYADCPHEARPVTAGYRVVLTYNLMLPETSAPQRLPEQSVQAVADALTRHWNTPAPSRWAHDRERPAPDRLVFLLDHEYTQRSLSWKSLKGVDRPRALALREAARLLDAQVALAQADIHETWSVEPDPAAFSGSWRRPSRYGEQESDMQLQDLIDHDIELRHWCGFEGEPPQPTVSPVSDDELCFVRPTVDFDPYESEYEGFMGNYGDTMDRWYHRAAVVIWPKDRRFIMQARQDPLWGLQQIRQGLQSGQHEQALLQTQALLAHWKPGHIHADARDLLLTAALPVAVGIEDAVVAMALLEPFGLEDLAADAVTDFLALIPQYGVSWTRQCLQAWETTRGPQAPRYVPERARHWVVNTLPSLVRHTADSNSAEAIDLIRPVIDTYWAALNQDLARIRGTAGQASSIGEQQKLAPAMLVLLDAAHALHGADREQAMMDTLQSGVHPLPFLLGILHAASEAPAWRRLSSLRTWCTDLLTRLLDTPARAPGDWSISAPGDFPEAAAPIFKEFLRSSQQQSLTWPLAKAGRDSIQAWIRHHGLPIRCSVLKTGSPHKLVLEKTRNLFVQATRERQAMVQELAWLRSHAD